jgi:WD40 repeat protein/tRNA A-37 threonylcarbamoyl transferase component Bud32
MSDTPRQGDVIDPEQARQIDAVCNRFEAAWKSGNPPTIESFLTGWSGSERHVLLRELVLLDVYYRRQCGPPAEADVYHRFTDFDPAWLNESTDGNSGPPAANGTTTLDFQTVSHPDSGEDRVGSLPRCIGDYEIESKIAHGGMGVVYKARQKGLGRVVALKMILAGQLATEAQVRRFHSEAKNTASLEHPNIVPIYEVGEHEGLPFFSMKFIEGGSLAGQSNRYRGDPRAAARLVADAARAVHHAHQRGILHRDLKPANILLDTEGRPHVTDFGLAKRVADALGSTQSGAIIGTAGYMAPEQAAGNARRVTIAADVYSLGAVLYDLLTGRPPFTGDSPMDVVLQALDRDPVPPSRHCPKVPRDLETVCLKCLRKEPQGRYDSADALARDLDHYLAGEPIEARPSGPVERAVRWVRRHPAPAALLAVGTAAVLGLVWGVMSAAANARLAEANGKLEVALAEAEANRREADRLRGVAAEQEARTNRLFYVTQMNLARRAFEEKNLAEALALLDKLRPVRADQEDLRGPEWYDLWQRCGGDQVALRGHTSPVTAVRFSPNGKVIASADSKGEIKLWDAWAERELRTLRGHEGGVTALAFDRDGGRLASAGQDGTVRVWEVVSGRPLACCRGHKGKVLCIAFAPDGQQVAGGGQDGRVLLWDGRKDAEGQIFAETGGPVHSLAFAEGGRRIVAAGNDRVVIWTNDPDAGQKEPSKTFSFANAAEETVFCLSLSDDGRYLAVGLSTEGERPPKGKTAAPKGKVVVWAVMTATRVVSSNTNAPVVSATISPDSLLLAISDWSRRIQTLQSSGGLPFADFQGPAEVTALAFSPDGQRIAAADEDRAVRVWGIAAPVLNATGEVNNAVFAPDGQSVAACVEGEVSLWDARTGAKRGHWRGTLDTWAKYQRVIYSPDGRFLCAGNILRTANTGEERTLRARGKPGLGTSVYSMAFSQDGSLLATAKASFATVYNVRTLDVVYEWEPPSGDLWITAVALSPDGTRLALGCSGMGSLDYQVQVREFPSGRLLLTLERCYSVWDLAFSPDGSLLAAACGDYQREASQRQYGQVRLWDVASGEKVATLRDYPGCVWSVAFSPDGRRLASASGRYSRGDGGEVRIWDLVASQEVARWRDPKNAVMSVAYSPDGKTLVTAERKGSIRLRGATVRKE